MTKTEINQIRKLASQSFDCAVRKLPDGYNVVYIESFSGSRLDIKDTLGRFVDDSDASGLYFANCFLARFEAFCEVLHLFDGTTYSSLYDFFGIPCGGVE